MTKAISVAFISQKIKEEWEALQKGKFQDRQLYEFIKRAIDDLKSNPTCGIKISFSTHVFHGWLTAR
ncbi:hypothetical protein HYU14_01385 [Candidatus Woesearchaeota archaeon]|nr:hypothetical protein [Candidatus Woesearchaeota archaeon]